MEITCQACGKTLRIGDEHAGKTIRCPQCKQPTKAVAPLRRSATTGQPNATRPPASPTVQCPGCKVSIRRPAAPQASAIRCPKCQTVVPLKSPQSRGQSMSTTSVPAARRPAPPKPAPAPSSSPAFDPFASSSSPYAAPLSSAPVAASTTSSSLTPKGGGHAKAIGPAVCLIIQGVVAILSNFVATILVVIQSPDEDADVNPSAVNVVRLIWGVWCLLGIGYQAVILSGSVAMIRGRSLMWAKTAAIMAIIPITAMTFGFCSGVVFYFLALGGGIWALMSLGSSQKSTGFAGATNSAGSYASAGNFAPKPAAPAWGAAAKQNANSSGDVGPLKGAAFIVGGIACLGAAGFFAYTLYSYYAVENSETQLRRPGKAIGGTISMLILGISLISSGVIALMKKK